MKRCRFRVACKERSFRSQQAKDRERRGYLEFNLYGLLSEPFGFNKTGLSNGSMWRPIWIWGIAFRVFQNFF